MTMTTPAPVPQPRKSALPPTPCPSQLRFRPPRRPGLRVPARLLAAATVLAGFTAGCSHPEDRPLPNRPPSVRITGGPLEESRASYTARVYWTGWDEDGFVEHYEYALDPPDAFTEEEIAHPETTPGLVIEVRLGRTNDRDTLRVSKIHQGEVVSFDWVETPEFNRSFAFSTLSAESTSVGGRLSPVNIYSGVHRIYVRSRDNEGAPSEPDRIGYTALSVTPSATIVQPDITLEINNLGSVLSSRWEGLDPDSPTADKRPTGYLYKLLRLDTLIPPVPLVGVSSPDILFRRAEAPWIYQSAESLDVRINLGTPGQYVFGVRAVDSAGAVEPFLAWGRNAFKFQSFPTGGKPILTLTGSTIQPLQFRGTQTIAESEAPAGARLRFRWTATAQDYGGTIEAFSWGVDIPDLSAEGPESGWSGWGPVYGNPDPLVFQEPGIRVLYVRVRDVTGALTIATLVIQVVEFTQDRDVLLVDDSFDDLGPRDSQHDAFWRDILGSYGGYPGTGVDTFDAFGPDDRTNLDPLPPKLSEMGRYKLIVWECRGSGYDGRTALHRAAATSPLLATYLASGGALWLGGRMTVGATFPSDQPNTADLTYPKVMAPGDFAYDFLKLHSTRINNDRGSAPQNNIYLALPFQNRPAIYDTMSVDSAKTPLGRQGASFADAVFDPIFAESETSPPFRGDIDTLYAYGAAGPILLNRGSIYHQRLTGIRWHDPDPDREHGRTQWFGFPMYYFRNSEARETLRRSMDWFFEVER